MRDVYATTMELSVLVEELGFDDIWLSEHHFAEDGYLPAPLIAAAAIGARTARLRIGTFALLAPFYHPVRLAEACAVIDNLTDGRFLLGIGLGYRPQEFEAIGMDRRKRAAMTDEIIEIVVKCWTEDEFSYHGSFFTLTDVRCVPKPVQQPRIPLWVAGYKGRAVERAARLGDGWLSAGAKSDINDRNTYIDALRAVGKPTDELLIANADIPLYQFCSANPARDRAIIEPLIQAERRQVARWQTEGNNRPAGAPDLKSEVLIATPDVFIEQIQAAYRRGPFVKYLFNPLIDAGVPPDMVRRSLELFAAEVLPAVQSLRMS